MAGYDKLNRYQLLELLQAKDKMIEFRKSQVERLEKRLEHSEEERRALETQLADFIAQATVRAYQRVVCDDGGAGDVAAGSSSSGKSKDVQAEKNKGQTRSGHLGVGIDTISAGSRSMVTDVFPDQVLSGSDGCGFPFARDSLGELDPHSALAAVVPSVQANMKTTTADEVQSIAESQEKDFQALESMACREDAEVGQDEFNPETFPDMQVDVAARSSGSFRGKHLKEVGAPHTLKTVEEDHQSCPCPVSWPSQIKQVEELTATDPEAARKLCVFIWGFKSKDKPVQVKERVASSVNLSHPLPAEPQCGWSRWKGGCATVACHNEVDAAAVLSAFSPTSKMWEEPKWSDNWQHGDSYLLEYPEVAEHPAGHWVEASTWEEPTSSSNRTLCDGCPSEVPADVVEYLKAHGGEADLSVIGGKFQMKKKDFEQHFDVIPDPKSTARTSQQFLVRLRLPPKVLKVVEYLKAHGRQAKLATVGGKFQMTRAELESYFDVRKSSRSAESAHGQLTIHLHASWSDD